VKIESVRYLLMRDFDSGGAVRTVDDDRVCYETIEDDAGYARCVSSKRRSLLNPQ